VSLAGSGFATGLIWLGASLLAVAALVVCIALAAHSLPRTSATDDDGVAFIGP
jgi:hypothetical protein